MVFSKFNKIKKLPINKLILILVLISFILTALLPLFAYAEEPTRRVSIADKQKILSDLSKKKDDVTLKLREARLKEAYATDRLNSINHKLKKAQDELQVNQKYLESNRVAWEKTRSKLDDINSEKETLEVEARRRVLSIYKQSRLKLLDGLINSPSVTDYMDHLYYQKRIMEYDNKVIQALLDQSDNIQQYKKVLADEATKMKEVNDKLKTITTEINAQRQAQKQLLSRLQNERILYEETERQLERESLKLMYKITELSPEKLDNPEATGNFIYPVQARITSPFGPRKHPIFGVRSMHSGIDLAAPRGTPIKASEGGVVIYSGWYGGYGKVVILDHSKGFSTLYAHLDSIAVSVGERVKQGGVVGYEGATGYATGPHLHFEVRSQGRPQNPILYLGDA